MAAEMQRGGPVRDICGTVDLQPVFAASLIDRPLDVSFVPVWAGTDVVGPPYGGLTLQGRTQVQIPEECGANGT